MTDLNKIRAAQVRAAEQAAIADLPPELLAGMEPKSPCAQPAPGHTPSCPVLVQRITDYLASGGLFNPEMADHNAVRDLLMESAST